MLGEIVCPVVYLVQALRQFMMCDLEDAPQLFTSAAQVLTASKAPCHQSPLATSQHHQPAPLASTQVSIP
jgi:hypothetical protein